MTEQKATTRFNQHGTKPFVLISLDEVINPCAQTRKALIDACPAGRRDHVQDYLTRTAPATGSKPAVSAGMGSSI